jgi:hypothetical protein
MIDIAELETRLKKAQSRAEKAKIALESASIEVTRLETALSVIREMSGNNAPSTAAVGNLTQKQQIVINSLKYGQNNAMSPVDIYQVASGDPAFNGDVNYVRTTLWRMADKGAIGGANGTYWKHSPNSTNELIAVDNSTPLSPELDALLEPPNITKWSWEDDSEAPF